MRVAVTGWTGNIGRLLTKNLERSGFEVIRVGRQPQADYQIDLSLALDDLAVAPYCDVLVLLAWYTDHPHFWMSQLNEVFVDTSIKLVTRFQTTNPNIRVIGAGSCAELYSTSQSKYELGHAKRRLRQLLENTCGVSTTWFQIFFAYGPGEPETKLLPIIKHNNDPSHLIKEPGAVRDFIHFDDIALTIEESITDVRQGCFHLGRGYGYLIEDLIQYKLSGKIPPTHLFSEHSKWTDFKVANPTQCWPGRKNDDQILQWLRE